MAARQIDLTRPVAAVEKKRRKGSARGRLAVWHATAACSRETGRQRGAQAGRVGAGGAEGEGAAAGSRDLDLGEGVGCGRRVGAGRAEGRCIFPVSHYGPGRGMARATPRHAGPSATVQ